MGPMGSKTSVPNLGPRTFESSSPPYLLSPDSRACFSHPSPTPSPNAVTTARRTTSGPKTAASPSNSSRTIPATIASPSSAHAQPRPPRRPHSARNSPADASRHVHGECAFNVQVIEGKHVTAPHPWMKTIPGRHVGCRTKSGPRPPRRALRAAEMVLRPNPPERRGLDLVPWREVTPGQRVTERRPHRTNP
jgi:hypothetical protein